MSLSIPNEPISSSTTQPDLLYYPAPSNGRDRGSLAGLCPVIRIIVLIGLGAAGGHLRLRVPKGGHLWAGVPFVGGHRSESCHLDCESSCGDPQRMMGRTTNQLGNEHGMSINELCHYLLFPGLFVAFTYSGKQPPASGASPYFLCTPLSPLGPSFRHIPSNFSNYNVFTNSNANAPLFYQISGTWSNHEGSISPRCRIPSFYGFPFCYRVQPRSHNVSKRGGRREAVFCSFVSSFTKNSFLSLPRYEQQSGAAPPNEVYTPFYEPLFLRERSWEETRLFAGDDPILAIHPPRIYAGDVASAMGFGLCRSKMMNGIVALYSPMQKDATERNRTLCSAGCVGARTGALMDTGREEAKRVVHNGEKDTKTLPLRWTVDANTVVFYPKKDREQIRIWILTCRWFLTVGILPGRTSSVRSGLLAPVHSSATDSTQGIFPWRFFLLITGISLILFFQIKQRTSVHRTYKKKIVVVRSTLVHLRNSAYAQPSVRGTQLSPHHERISRGSLKPPMDSPSHEGQFESRTVRKKGVFGRGSFSSGLIAAGLFEPAGKCLPAPGMAIRSFGGKHQRWRLTPASLYVPITALSSSLSGSYGTVEILPVDSVVQVALSCRQKQRKWYRRSRPAQEPFSSSALPPESPQPGGPPLFLSELEVQPLRFVHTTLLYVVSGLCRSCVPGSSSSCSAGGSSFEKLAKIRNERFTDAAPQLRRNSRKRPFLCLAPSPYKFSYKVEEHHHDGGRLGWGYRSQQFHSFVPPRYLISDGDEIPLFVVDPEMPTGTSDGIRPSRSRIEDRVLPSSEYSAARETLTYGSSSTSDAGYSAICVLLYLILEASGDGSRRRPFLVVQQQSEDELVRSVGLHLIAARSGLLGSAIYST
eukprot:Gb_33989 [translate_table: standard]